MKLTFLLNNAITNADERMAMSRSFKECGSDEARDDDDDPDICSHCATDGKLQPALYFCFNCGVYGRYMCGICLRQHNRFVKNHEIEKIANRSACNRLDYENKKTMKVEKDLKSKEAEVMLLEEQVNEYSKVNQCHQERIKDLETACQNLEKEKNQGEKMATRNLEHLQNILKDKTKTAADEYKNLLAKMDNLQDRAQENDLKVKSLQHSNEELHKENAALLTELKQVKSENENLSKELIGCKNVLAVEGEKFDHKTKIQECERDTNRKGSKLIFKGKDDSYTGYSRQGEIADGKLHSGDVRTIEYKPVVVAIEIGNTGSCCAYAFKHESIRRRIYAIDEWYCGSGCKKVSIENRSVVLFDENKKFHSFGFEADDAYVILAENGEHTKWFYFKNLTMKLRGSDITRDFEIDDDKGKKMKAIDVFGAVIQYLKDYLLDQLKTRGPEVQNNDIHWVLTVPAIWTDSAKQFMREAAYSADIAESQLTIITEPEAAIVYFQMENQIEQLTTVDISSPGTKCMVIDLGGNTADFTILERQSDGGLSEIKSATGIACGENMVIEEFHELLRNITGDAVYQKWIVDGHPGDQTDLQNEIESKTRTLKTYSTGKVTFRFPDSLPNTFKEINHESIQQAIERSQYKGRITWLSDKIRIDKEIVKTLFKPCTDRIVGLVNLLLKEPGVQGTSIFLIVAKAQIVQKAIKKAFPTVNVIIPKEPDLAVLKGAVIYGHQH
ncbi:heat shock 70 kDa protein 12A-like [Ruditapes philippinarum]|uniref:heat shock 70 kDa protein 12A-like n=1 Tax=Ruditapes philippinarum TaxID=129788 RepID=UPI00295B4E98|nr:heat shock 70 kDa protein 12A-like [Ruditapes philippinarum]